MCWEFLSEHKRVMQSLCTHHMLLPSVCTRVPGPLPHLRSLMNLPVDTKFSEDECREYFIDLILGLEYCKWL